MKTPLLLLILMGLLLSCGKSNDSTGGSSSRSERNEQQQQERTSSEVSVTSSIKVSQTHIQFLETKEMKKKIQGKSCYVATKKGYSFPFELYDSELILTQNDEDIELTRVSGNTYSLNGTWEREDQIEGYAIKLTVRISNTNSMTITTSCQKEK